MHRNYIFPDLMRDSLSVYDCRAELPQLAIDNPYDSFFSDADHIEHFSIYKYWLRYTLKTHPARTPEGLFRTGPIQTLHDDHVIGKRCEVYFRYILVPEAYGFSYITPPLAAVALVMKFCR
jgi:hypothetical protein